jgi:glutamate-1-semialdehyde 2,1-aminomutase
MKKRDRLAMQNRLKKSKKEWERANGVLLSHYAVSTWGRATDVVFIKQSKGGRIIDIDGNEYVDLCMAYGALILGHGHEAVKEAIHEAVEHGAVHGFGHKFEVELAELMVDAIPFAEIATFANSGTEATMHALKVARAYTGKDKIAKFEGCYHGNPDILQISVRGAVGGSVEKPQPVPLAGVSQKTIEQVVVLSYNQPETFDIIRSHKDELAAVIVEPIPTCCPINFKEFLQELRQVTAEANVFLIFDEVLSGFRFNYGSIASEYDIVPDLAVFGKVMGGGLPIGAIVGSKDKLSPLITSGNLALDVRKNPFITGTFSGNPVSTAAGAATLRFLKDHPEVYDHVRRLSSEIRREIEAFAQKINFPFQTLGVGPWFLPYFASNPVARPRDVNWLKTLLNYDLFIKYMRKNGVLISDVPLLFTCASHTEEDKEFVIKAIQQSLEEMY